MGLIPRERLYLSTPRSSVALLRTSITQSVMILCLFYMILKHGKTAKMQSGRTQSMGQGEGLNDLTCWLYA